MNKRIQILFSFFCFLSVVKAQLVSTNHTFQYVKKELNINDAISNKRSASIPKNCNVDTVEYSLSKASGLYSITISRGRSLGQLYSCPRPIEINGFTFYAFIPNLQNTYRKMNIICNLYRAGADSLPRGAALRSDTIEIDTNFYRGVIANMEKHASWKPITLDSNYIITVETDTASFNGSVLVNSYIAGDGKRENLNCGSISGLWYSGRNLNVGGTPFNCDVLLHPHVKYKFGTDFSIKNNCYNLTDTVKFINNAPSNLSGSRMYNRYLLYNLGYFCHWWNDGSNFGTTYSVDYKAKYNTKGNYNVRVISTVYGYRGNENGCQDTTIKLLSFKPDLPSVSGPSNACIGDTAKFIAVSNDAGVNYQWYDKQNSASPFLINKNYNAFPLTVSDTFYLKASNNGCLSNTRTHILNVNAYPSSLTYKDDSICSGSKANLKGNTDKGVIEWFANSNSPLPFYTGNVLQTQVLTSDTFYYIHANNKGCILGPKTMVKANVGSNFAPNPPTVSNDTNVCLSNNPIVNLSATAQVGLTIRWFDVASGGSSINTGNSLMYMPTQRGVKEFYADAFNGVCGSTRVQIKVNTDDYPAVSKLTLDTICNGDSVYLNAQVPYGNVYWYDAATNGNLLKSGDNLSDKPNATKNYYVQTESGICISPNRTIAKAVVNNYPVINRLIGDTICAKNSAVLKGILTGVGNLYWYESDTSSNKIHNGLIFNTPILNGSKRYYARSEYAGCISPIQSVLPTVLPVPFSGFSYDILTFQQVRVAPINAGSSSIKWDFGDGFKSSNGNVTHRYQTPGKYKIKLTLTSLTNGCQDSTIIFVDILTSSVSENKLNKSLLIYPNPANTKIQLSGDLEIKNAKIYNSSGQIIKQVQFDVNSIEQMLDISELSKGLYIITIDNYSPKTFIVD